jgi:hypothetical protein
MTLLSIEADGHSAVVGGLRAQGASLPKLDQRIGMLASTFSGPDGSVTVEMRAAARDLLLTAMAADLVDETTAFALRDQDSRDAAAPVDSATLPAAVVRSPREVRRVPRQSSAGFARGLQDLISSLAAPFSARRFGMAAVPLVALLVAGSMWTQSRFAGTKTSDQAAPDLGAAANGQATRGLGPLRLDTAAEQDLERTIAAEEALHGGSTAAVARELVDLASLFRADGRYAEAQSMCERALIIEDRVLGPKNPETIRTTKELAAVYRAQGRDKDADAILSRTDQP